MHESSRSQTHITHCFNDRASYSGTTFSLLVTGLHCEDTDQTDFRVARLCSMVALLQTHLQ
eukprot:m.299089 g.299089  ORF g.299089 m.299089 type:complete len:61 (-) comp15867_c1_seq2:1370-1552(-)